MRWLLLAVSLTAPLASAADPPPGASRVAAADVDQAAAAARLSGRTLEALDAILGPGRAKVLVEVRGERYRLRTETEMITPLDPGLFDSAGSSSDSGPLVRILDLPGYSKGKKLDPVLPGALTGGLREEKEKAEDEEKKAAPLYTQRDHEQSERDGGFEIKQVMAQVVIDAAVPEERAREASQLLPTLLMIDGSRGDTLTISRAAFQPAWKGAFADPASLRRLAYAGAAVLTALLVVLIAGASFVRAARVFATELGRRRTEELEGGAAEPLPELVPGAPGGFLDADAEGAGEGARGAPAALGRRFDFLADREPAHCAHALAGERPEDAAMVFGHLASSMPEVASRTFALLPPDFQAEVSSQLLKLRVADPDRLAEIEERLKRAVEHGLQGSERLGRILSRVPLDTRSDLLGRLTLRDHEGAAEVERHLFTIEDLETLSPVELRRLIAAVPYEAWGFALRGTPQGVVDRVLAELPEGPRELVRDLLSSPQPRDKVLEARSKVLDARGELAAKGEIKLGEREAGSELL
jgi:hypothetical protein